MANWREGLKCGDFSSFLSILFLSLTLLSDHFIPFWKRISSLLSWNLSKIVQIIFLKDFPRSQTTLGSLVLANILNNSSKGSRGFSSSLYKLHPFVWACFCSGYSSTSTDDFHDLYSFSKSQSFSARKLTPADSIVYFISKSHTVNKDGR